MLYRWLELLRTCTGKGKIEIEITNIPLKKKALKKGKEQIELI
jgi:hypothetical protein